MQPGASHLWGRVSCQQPCCQQFAFASADVFFSQLHTVRERFVGVPQLCHAKVVVAPLFTAEVLSHLQVTW
jgi:hypothetical protein